MKILRSWDSIVYCLVLIRLGQELGSDTKFSRLIHDFIELLLLIK